MNNNINKPNNFDIKNYISKSYLHFDFPLTTAEATNFLSSISTDVLCKHRYLPFITYSIVFKKYLPKEKDVKPKRRKISLSSHHDALIYKYYSEILGYNYEKYVKNNNFQLVATAYRKNIGMDSIKAAREVFNFIDQTNESWIIKGDFHHFFDTLNHKILIKNIKEVLNVTVIPNDWKKMLTSLLKFKSISREKLKSQLSMVGINSPFKRNNQRAYIKNIRMLGELIKNNQLIFSNKNNVGIPQGTAISATLANVYMINFDKQINKITKHFNGIYRRYSDDFIIVIPTTTPLYKIISFKRYIVKRSQNINLTIEPHKTKIFKFESAKSSITKLSYSNKKLKNNKSNKISSTPSSLDYLGFMFDGISVSLRPKSIYKYSYKSKRALKRLIMLENDNHISSLGNDEIQAKIQNYYVKKYPNGHEPATWRIANNYERKNYVDRIIAAKSRKINDILSFHKNVTRRYLCFNPRGKNISMMNYAIRAQKEFNKSQHSYNVVILKQVKRQIKRNQIALGKNRKNR